MEAAAEVVQREGEEGWMSPLLDPMAARFQARGGEAERGAQRQLSLVSYHPPALVLVPTSRGTFSTNRCGCSKDAQARANARPDIPHLASHHTPSHEGGHARLPPLPSRPLFDVWTVTAGHTRAQDRDFGRDAVLSQ